MLPSEGDPCRTASSAPILEDAIALAATAHRGQGYPTSALRREPFILHPMRVVLRVETDVERVVAALHDIIEDTDYTLNELRRLGYPSVVVEAVDRLTRRAGESYADYIERVAEDRLARRVKLADLVDNLANNRGVESTAIEQERAERYEEAQARLLAVENGSQRHMK